MAEQESFGLNARKLILITGAARCPTLTRADLVILVALLDYVRYPIENDPYPAMGTLARLTGVSTRQVIRAIDSLVKHGIIEIAERGAKGRSSRYRIHWQWEMVTPMSPNGVTPMSPNSVTPMSEDSDTHVTKTVTPMSPETPSIKTVLKKQVLIEGSQADGDASPGALPSGAGGRPPGKDRYPEFWQAIGRRTTVAAAEGRLTKLIAAGADYQEIVDGATRYRAYCDVAGGAKISSDKWLQGEKWRDDWTPPARRGAKTTKKSPAKTKKKRASPNPNKKRSLADLCRLTAARESEPGRNLKAHTRACPICHFASSWKKYCSVGGGLQQDLFDWVRENMQPNE